jgi:hypothetical protein
MAGSITISTLNNDTGVLAAQNGMTGICKAWVNYNADTQTILGSFNTSSVTYSSTGNYVMNFTTAMPNANYCPVVNSTRASPNQLYFNAHAVPASTTACNIFNGFADSFSGTNPGNSSTVCVAILSS